MNTISLCHYNHGLNSDLCLTFFQLNAQKNVKFIETHCYAGHYVFTLLADGYKFDTDTWKNITFQQQVG